MTPYIKGPMREALLAAGCTVKKGRWSDGNASAVFTQSRDKEMIINELWATVTGQGHGSRLLEAICRCADATGTVLLLVITPYRHGMKGQVIFRKRPEGLGKRQLQTWYVRHGFRDGEFQLFERKPKKA